MKASKNKTQKKSETKVSEKPTSKRAMRCANEKEEEKEKKEEEEEEEKEGEVEKEEKEREKEEEEEEDKEEKETSKLQTIYNNANRANPHIKWDEFDLYRN